MTGLAYRLRLTALTLMLVVGALAIMAQTYSTGSSSGSSFNYLWCICPGFVLLIGIGARVYTSQAAPYIDEVVVPAQAQQVAYQIQQYFPRQGGRPWKHDQNMLDPSTLVVSTYLIPYWGCCLLMLLSGLIWGALVYFLVMGRSEKVMLRVLPQSDGTRVSISSKGSYGAEQARSFSTMLRMVSGRAPGVGMAEGSMPGMQPDVAFGQPGAVPFMMPPPSSGPGLPVVLLGIIGACFLAAVVVVIILALLGPAIGNIFSSINNNL